MTTELDRTIAKWQLIVRMHEDSSNYKALRRARRILQRYVHIKHVGRAA